MIGPVTLSAAELAAEREDVIAGVLAKLDAIDAVRLAADAAVSSVDDGPHDG